MKKPRPTVEQNGVITKEALAKRQQEENRLKGSKAIPKTPPASLCERGKKLYKEIITSLPKGFLSNLDLNTLIACIDSAVGMEKCREIIQAEGVIVTAQNGAQQQNPALLALTKYSDIFRRYADDLGLTPASRAKLAVLKAEQIEEENDPLLQVLKGGKKARNL